MQMTTITLTPESEGRPLTAADVQEGDTVSAERKWSTGLHQTVTGTVDRSKLSGLLVEVPTAEKHRWTITSISRPVVPEQVELPSEEAAWRKAIADQVRRNCTPPNEAYEKGGDVMIYAVADWIENPPEWSKFTPPADSGREAAIAEVIDWFEAQGLGGYWIHNAKKYFALVPEAEGEKA